MQNVQILELSAATIYLMDLTDFKHTNIIHLLNEEEKKHLNEIKSEQKKKEYTAIRWMKTNLFGTDPILYTEDGSPTIDNSSFISISHTTKYACLGVSKTYKIGIDIEEIREKAVSVIFDTTNNFDMTLLWSLKEALYKLSDRQQLLFKIDICIDKRSPEIVARVRFESGFKTVSLGYLLIDSHIFTFTTSAPL
jgi:4'-phosphopantetheinyl transferase EntD